MEKNTYRLEIISMNGFIENFIIPEENNFNDEESGFLNRNGSNLIQFIARKT